MLLSSSSAFLVAVLAVSRSAGHRLPDDAVPESYVLKISPDLGTATFAGQVDIAIRAKNTVHGITLHSRDLVWEAVNVTDRKTYRDVPVDRWDRAEDREQVRIVVGGHLLAGRVYTVSVRFSGRLRDDATGFFTSDYVMDSDGQQKWLAATQFQATHARSAFPCYDEPGFKAPFNISIKRKQNEIALSNMPILKTVNVREDGANATWVEFARTPPMCARSVALFVGDFERLHTDRQNATNVYSHLGELYQTEYATGGAPRLLAAAERYTGVAYPLPKLDLIAVPELAAVGVSDGWGLNAYREQLLFVDKSTKTKTKIVTKTTAGHAIARQWFGDLVTPVWWDFAWLDLGFATYFEYFVTATVEPDWRLEHFFVVEKHQAALERDRTSGRPLSTSVSTSEEIDSVFDRISYDKGAAVLRMLHSWVGEEVFRKAVNTYLNRNRYGVVKPQELWNAFDNALIELTGSNLHGENVHTIMSSWVDQPGYPVVHVEELEDKMLILTQERFSNQQFNVNNTAKWYIHLSYTSSEDSDLAADSAQSVWLDPTSEWHNFGPISNKTKWYIFNVQSTGFYRVNYTEDNWLSLIKQLNDSPKDIHVLNRAQLIDDSFSLARAGLLSYTIPLSLIRYLDKEDDVIPWFSAMNSLNFVLDRMRRSANGYDDVKAFVSKLAGIAFQMVDKLVAEQQSLQYPINVGWNAFSAWACRLDNEDCTKTALNYFRRWRNGEEIPADVKDATFCTGVRRGAEQGNWAKMLELYKTTSTYSEKESALNALACTDDENLLIKYLKLILENKCPIESRDYEAFFTALSSTPSGINALTFFLANNFMDIVNKVPKGDDMVNTIFSILAAKVSTESEIKMMSEIAFSTKTPVEYRNKFSPIYRAEIEYNDNWFDSNNSITIREFVNPMSTNGSETIDVTTQDPRIHYSSRASSSWHSCIVLSCILAIFPVGIQTVLE